MTEMLARYFWVLFVPLAVLTIIANRLVTRGMTPLLALEDSAGQLPDIREHGYTLRELKEFLGSCEGTKLQEYRSVLGSWDLCYAILYSSTWSLILLRLSDDTGYLLVFSLAPLLAGLCDFLENLCLRHVCGENIDGRDLTRQRWVVGCASFFTKQKWWGIRFSLMLTALIIVHDLYHRSALGR